MKKLGFVGLGMMGLPMVENLAKVEGLHVWAHDQRAQQQAALQGHAAWGRSLFWAESLKDLAACDVVITMLPNSQVTNAVIAGHDGQAGLAQVLLPGALVIDMGSSHPGETARLAGLLEAAGIEFVDAPVSGAVVKARSGALAIMAGGTPAAVERAMPVLQHMGAHIICTGGIASAHAMKALNNYVYAAGLLATSEALLIAHRMGLNEEVFAEVLNASSGRNVATETKLRQFLIPRDFNGGFALRLQAKDLATADALRLQTGVQAPQLAQCTALWKDAAQELAEHADNTSVYQYLEAARA